MKLTLSIPDKHYHKLTTLNGRRAAESELSSIFYWARITGFESQGKTWHRNGNGRPMMTEAEVFGATCSLDGE